jgi:hypothetical protein
MAVRCTSVVGKDALLLCPQRLAAQGMDRPSGAARMATGCATDAGIVGPNADDRQRTTARANTYMVAIPGARIHRSERMPLRLCHPSGAVHEPRKHVRGVLWCFLHARSRRLPSGPIHEPCQPVHGVTCAFASTLSTVRPRPTL